MKKTIRKPRTPALRLHKASGRTFATFSNPANVDAETGSIESWKVWFGPKGRDAERRFRAYRAQWELNDWRRPDEGEHAGTGRLTVRDLVDRYRAHVRQRRGEGWWLKNRGRFELAVGTTTGRGARGDSPLLADYGNRPASTFGSPQLVELFESMAAAGNLCQSELNARLDIVRKLFQWAAALRLVPTEVGTEVALVERAKQGELGLRASKSREPVADDVVEATLAYMPAHHADRVRLLRLTGARPAELYKLTPAMLDRTGVVWTADDPELATGKRLVHDRMLAFGPKAQEILRPLLLACAATRPLFRDEATDARSAVQALGKEIRRAIRRANVARATEGLLRLARREGESAARRLLRDRYRVAHFAKWTQDDGLTRTRLGTLAELVQRVGDRRVAELVRDVGGEPVPEWTAYQLRHSRLPEVRRTFGIEGAAAIGGHSLGKEWDTTEGYTRGAQRERAVEIARKTG
ncbi:MAG: hypothetical protein KAI24_14635 [Planctomycetes bacterium]|nr:hypothetical protein [Planctomycetota bacterium]